MTKGKAPPQASGSIPQDKSTQPIGYQNLHEDANRFHTLIGQYGRSWTSTLFADKANAWEFFEKEVYVEYGKIIHLRHQEYKVFESMFVKPGGKLTTISTLTEILIKWDLVTWKLFLKTVVSKAKVFASIKGMLNLLQIERVNNNGVQLKNRYEL